MNKHKRKLKELRLFQEKNGEKLDLNTFNKLTSEFSYSDSALLWFQLNLNNIVKSEELAQIHGKNTGQPISHNIRRIFELRDEKGYNIINHKTKGSNLKVDQWILLDEDPDEEKIRERGVNKRIRMDVFKRDDYTCQVCGLSQGDDDPYKEGRKITLHVGHITAHKRKDESEPISHKKLDVDDFITMCNVCNEGLKNNDFKIITLKDRVEKASVEEQLLIYEFLKSKFN